MMTARVLVPTTPGRKPAGIGTDNGSDQVLVGMLAVFAAALFLIPNRYTVPVSSRLGLRPHQIVLVIVTLSIVNRFLRGKVYAIGRPALVTGLLALTAVASTVVNSQRLSNASFLASIRLLSTTFFYVLFAIVVALLATTRRRRRFIIGAVVTMIAISALFAIRESVTAEPVRITPTPPGLVEDQELTGGAAEPPHTVIRNNVPRPSGTAANALELSAVMALGLPFAIYLAFSAAALFGHAWFITCSLLIAVGVMLSISRTGVLAVAVMLVVAFLANLKRPKVILIGLGAVAILAYAVVLLIPQSVDATITQFGKNGNEDPSLATRLQDYEELNNLLGPYPWFGRGPDAVNTYVARDGGGLILDNQYLLLIAEVGVVGLAALVTLLLSAGVAAARRARAPTGENGLWVACLSAVVAYGLMCATFDAFRFPQATGILLVAVGLVSAAEPRLRPDVLAVQRRRGEG